jgi:hypothetical protein
VCGEEGGDWAALGGARAEVGGALAAYGGNGCPGWRRLRLDVADWSGRVSAN